VTLGNDNGTDGQTDRQADRRTDRVRRIMRPPPREEGRIITVYPLPESMREIANQRCLLGFFFPGSSNGPTAQAPEPIFT